jgi:hypothetical protein
MIFAHTGALAFMALCVPAGGGTNFLLTIRLDYIEFAMPRENTDHEIVEPSLGKLPALILAIPLWLGSPIISQPIIVILGVRHFYHELMAFAFSEHYRSVVLFPYCRKTLGV